MARDNGLILAQQIKKIGQVLLDPESVEFEKMRQTLSAYNLALYKTDAYENTQRYFVDNGLIFDVPHIDYFIDIDSDGQLPDKNLPVFPYSGCVDINVTNMDTLTIPMTGKVFDYLGREFTYQITQYPTLGALTNITLNGQISFRYQADVSNFHGEHTDIIKYNTQSPVKANFEGWSCITLTAD